MNMLGYPNQYDCRGSIRLGQCCKPEFAGRSWMVLGVIDLVDYLAFQ